MLRAQFRIQLPAEMWVAAVSQSHPTATFRLLSGVRMDETALELGDVKTDRPVVVSEAIKTHESVDDYEELAVSEDRVLAKYETTDTGLYAFVEQASLPPEFPITVQDGWYVFDLTGTRTEFDRLRAVLEQSELSYELLSLIEDGQKETLLTDRQQEVLSAAIQRGYFAVPRDCTLSDLADTFDVDKSTLSGVLRRGQARVITRFLVGSDTERVE